MKNKRMIIIIGAVALGLSVPLIAMQVTDEVSWTTLDFVVMGLLLSIVGFSIELVIRKFTVKNHRVAIIVIILLSFLVIWAELAVGIFGTPIAGN